jgi:hypothetical protein
MTKLCEPDTRLGSMPAPRTAAVSSANPYPGANAGSFRGGTCGCAAPTLATCLPRPGGAQRMGPAFQELIADHM